MADERGRASEAELAADNEGLMSSGEVRTGFVSGVTFRNKPVQYEVVDGLAMFEGCICLGTVEEMERRKGLVQAGATQGDEAIVHGVGISGDQYRWPNAVMPYEIDSDLPNQSRVTDAVAHWEQHTNIRFVERTSANASEHPNYVRIFRGNGCWSFVGMRGGRQDLSLADGCGFGTTVHEIGHALGLWHEQSRADRDSYITIHWDNITEGREHNFNQHITDGDDIGPYDYGSIMHYGRFAFSKNGQATITPTESGATIGQRNGLSEGDIAAVHHMYRTWHHHVTVALAFATPQHKNAWVYLVKDGIHPGWRRIHPNAPDGVTNTLWPLALARAYDRKVHVQLDGTHVYQVQGI